MHKSRVITAYIFVGFTFIILFLRYGYLQVINHTSLLQQSINNYSSIVATIPVRGDIIDTHGQILADSRTSYAISILKKDISNNPQNLFASLAKYITLTPLEKKKFVILSKNSKKYDWIIIKDDLDDKEVANLTAHNFEFPNLQVFARIKRYYKYKEVYAHSLGYVAKISQKDKLKLPMDNYVNTDYVGKRGLEEYYENMLRGKLGKKSIKTDATGNEVGLIDNIPATDGYTLKLTIDNNLQQLATNLLGTNKGAIVAINPQTGGVLAFVSKPSFDPNLFIDGISEDEWSDLRNDPDYPLLNRASQSAYPPGSTFKPFIALSALQQGVRTPNSLTYDPGYFVIPGSTHRFRDSGRGGGRGNINLFQAITYSSDTYFYKLGLDLGIDKADKILKLFGFGQKTGIDLPEENPGLLPSKEWKAKRFKNNQYQKNWQAADSVVFGIGQGFNTYTPLQMAYATSIIANDGLAIQPHFMDSFLDENGNQVESYQIKSQQLPIDKNYFKFIKSAMQNVILHGTASVISNDLKYTMAGKTGTAQVVALNQNNRQAKFSGRNYKDHSWFIAFAPVEKPQIAIAVIVENGGWGATKAVPIAKMLFNYYLLNESPVNSKIITAGENTTTNIESDESNNLEEESFSEN